MLQEGVQKGRFVGKTDREGVVEERIGIGRGV
jgi:hypothetical protein